ncbi:DUF771 domain-containing protein [Streptococcus himalayensis]|uniref:DUF771 domain-containing protein n=1 Tax=Streptococcus himalayensis TaxID=1888195 RepID=A0A917EFV8_9STRE|nr:DUF771 domain-containing protein [Streptococcus himalayensis]GGE37844.1 hypothetical protein GCM10011510_19030 [Streptococcus himalayensis]
MDTITINIEGLTVTLPETHILVSREDYKKLENKAAMGRYMSLSDVLELLSISRPWLLENVLYKPNIRKDIDIEQNPNGFVKYPHNQGGKYLFLASKTKEFFEQNFSDLLKGK